MTTNRAPGLPRARPSHHYGKVVSPPAISRPVFGAGAPQMGPGAAGPPPGSLADVMAKLAAVLAGTASKAVQLYIPDVYPIPTAIPFQVAGTVATTGAGTITQIPGTALKLPAGYIGLVHTLNISVLTAVTLATVQLFTIRINQAPAIGWANMTFAGRAAQNFERYFDAALRLPNGCLVDIINTNVDGGAYTVGADITGWYMSVADVSRWLQGQGQLTGN